MRFIHEQYQILLIRYGIFHLTARAPHGSAPQFCPQLATTPRARQGAEAGFFLPGWRLRVKTGFKTESRLGFPSFSDKERMSRLGSFCGLPLAFLGFAALLALPAPRATACPIAPILRDVKEVKDVEVERARHFEPHLGTRVKPLPEWGLPDGTEVRLLSDGVPNRSAATNFGASYVIDPQGPHPYVLKVYETPRDMNSDLRSLYYLKELMGEQPGAADFRVATSRGDGNATLRLSYARGRDLAHLLSDPEISPALKMKMAALFRDRMQSLIRKMAARNPKTARSEGLGSVERPWEQIPELHEVGWVQIHWTHAGQKYILNLNPKQVIVDPATLEMTIIDPY